MRWKSKAAFANNLYKHSIKLNIYCIEMKEQQWKIWTIGHSTHTLDIHLKKLGGRRKVNPESKNTSWRHAAFRGYADYMETASFDEGIKELKTIAHQQRTAYMCSEAVWWRCHRSMVSDYLKADGWDVQHIMQVGKSLEHPYTQPARIVEGELTYLPEN